jgi:hypothetical protein
VRLKASDLSSLSGHHPLAVAHKINLYNVAPGPRGLRAFQKYLNRLFHGTAGLGHAILPSLVLFVMGLGEAGVPRRLAAAVIEQLR